MRRSCHPTQTSGRRVVEAPDLAHAPVPELPRDWVRDLPRDLLAFVPLPMTGAARLWWVSLDVATDADAQLRTVLSAEERQRADAYPHPARGRRFALGRSALRLLLGGWTGRDPRDLSFASNPDGKPALVEVGGGQGTVHFNVSHARDLLLLAVCEGGPVGVDLSVVDDRLPIDTVAPRFFSSAERAALDAAPDEPAQRERFARLWVRKEAWLKGVGTGISERLRLTDFSAGLDGRVEIDGGAPALAVDDWDVRDITGVPVGYVAAVATRRTAGGGR